MLKASSYSLTCRASSSGVLPLRMQGVQVMCACACGWFVWGPWHAPGARRSRQSSCKQCTHTDLKMTSTAPLAPITAICPVGQDRLTSPWTCCSGAVQSGSVGDCVGWGVLYVCVLGVGVGWGGSFLVSSPPANLLDFHHRPGLIVAMASACRAHLGRHDAVGPPSTPPCCNLA